MTVEALHPDHLKAGDMVGPWRIVQVLGRGGSSRVFKVERDGRLYSMKMALLPLTQSKEGLSEEAYVEEESAYRRLAREAAALFTYASHPNLLAVFAVDFWPNPTRGYAFIVTDFVDGEDWHQWRWRKHPTAARLVETFSSVVRTVGVLHARGVYHRDLKAENILIRRQDGRPFLIDFGTVRLPGALTKTLGLPEGVLHLLPPELLAYTRTEAWKRGEPFHGGVAADLYALGVLLYQGLTDLHPFDPELPDKELVAAISSIPPTAPHILNPMVPRSLSNIAMRLLEKNPEDRYPDTEAVLQSLEKAAGQEGKSPAWKLPLTESESSAEAPVEENAAHQVAPVVEDAEPSQRAMPQEGSQRQVPATARNSKRRRRRSAILVGLLLLGAVGLLSERALLAPSPVAAHGASAPAQGGISPVPYAQDSAVLSRNSSFLSLLAAWLCAVTSLGCPAAQVKPTSALCPKDATESMFTELKIRTASPLRAFVDVEQPGEAWEMGLYKEGAVVGRITVGEGRLVEGSLLYGQLWTGPGLTDDVGREAVIGRYTRAVLPDGTEYPVCIALGGPDGRMPRMPGSRSGTVQLPRDAPLNAVWRWP